jgi:uncharacterized protein
MRIASFLCVAAFCFATPVSPATAEPMANREPLAPSSYQMLPLTKVKPRGWLREQLQIQASGLTGHLDEFWPDLGPNSAWLGGSGEGWERGPYYLDGLVPLAYLLEDPKLIAKAKPWIEWTLQNQRPDGGIGPEKNKDWWPNYIMLKVLTQYEEATGDKRVAPLMQKYFAYMAKNLDERPLHQWAIYRWHDQILSILWLYNRTGEPSLLELARKVRRQGFDWNRHFDNFLFTSKATRAQQNLSTHGVNNAMALKAPPVWWQVSKDQADRDGIYQMLSKLDQYHGLPMGIFSSDEHYAGRHPSQGIELCAVQEAMFSLEHALAILGDPKLGDRLETIAYNPHPGAMAADMWSHQYDQQPNQVLCTLSSRNWSSNGPESNMFGLEPNFGCCTANMHQGWPKFAANLWMASPDGGLVAAAYAPSEVRVTLKGVQVTVTEDTEYPFRDRITLTVAPARAASFPLLLRIPAWTTQPSIAVNGQAVSNVRPGTFHRIERQWNSGDKVEIRFPMLVRVVKGYNDSVSIERGPLVYALQVGETWHKVGQRGPAPDYELYPATPWNYALQIDPANPASSFTVEEQPLDRQPFQSAKPPVVIRAKGRRIVEWQLVDDSAAAPPASPVKSRRPLETLTLVPYGAARLRVTALPVLVE